ncbi:Fc.00g098620.m01.CDS01 [Cosmosporella sp. VM-42]
MTQEARKAAMKAMRERTLSITVNPPPVGFAERRSILHVLQQHGVVEFFKQAKNNDTVFVSVMKDPADVSRLVGLSPLKYGVSIPESTMETYLSDLSAPEKFRKTSITKLVKMAQTTANEKPEPKVEEAEGPPKKDFTIYAWPNLEYRHDRTNLNSPLYASWPESFEEDCSFVTQTLKQSLPDALAAKGLGHWDFDLGKSIQPGPAKSKLDERLETAKWIPSKMKKKAEKRQIRTPDRHQGPLLDAKTLSEAWRNRSLGLRS